MDSLMPFFQQIPGQQSAAVIVVRDHAVHRRMAYCDRILVQSYHRDVFRLQKAVSVVQQIGRQDDHPVDLADDQILQELIFDLRVMGIGAGNDRIIIVYKKLRYGADDRSPEIIAQVGNKDGDGHGTLGTQQLGGTVRFIIEVGDGFLNAEAVLFLDFFVVKIFRDRGQGKASLSGDIFDRDFHVLLRSGKINIQLFYHEKKKCSTANKSETIFVIFRQKRLLYLVQSY